MAKTSGAQQCGMGSAISIEEMQKDLKGIKVISQSVENDGNVRIQMCGAPTGDFNVYEIPEQYVDQAESYGFQKWKYEIKK